MRGGSTETGKYPPSKAKAATSQNFEKMAGFLPPKIRCPKKLKIEEIRK